MLREAASRRRQKAAPARRWPQMWCSNGAVVAPTKINQGRRPIQQSGSPRERARTNAAAPTPTSGVDSSPYDAITTSFNILPPATHPAKAIDQPAPPAAGLPTTYPPTRHRLPIVLPQRRAHRCRTQREWGMMTPGAQSPATDDTSSEGREKEAALPRVVEFCSLVKDGGAERSKTLLRVQLEAVDLNRRLRHFMRF